MTAVGAHPIVADVPVPAPELKPEREVDLRAVLLALRRRRPRLLLGFMIPMVLAAAYLALATRQYSATTVVVMEARKMQVVGRDTVLPQAELSTYLVGSEVNTIRSESSIARVVDTLRLTEDPEFDTDLDPDPPLLTQLARDAKQRTKDLLRDILGLEVTSTPVPQRLKVIEAVARRLDVDNIPRSYTITIGFSSRDAAKAATIANAFADQYIRDQLEERFASTSQAGDWLSARVTELEHEARVKEQAVREFQARHNLIETGGSTVLLRQLGELNSQLVIARADAAKAKATLITARDNPRGGLESASDVLASPLIRVLREQETMVRRKEADLAERFGTLHPQVQQVRSELTEVRRRIAEEARRIVEGLANQATALQARQEALETAVADLEARAAEAARAGAELGQLKVEAEAAQALHATFLARLKEVGGQHDLQRPDAKLVSRAEPSTSPSSPRTLLVLLGASGLGTFLGLVLVFIAERLDRGYRRTEQFEADTGLSVLSLVPQVGRRQPPESYMLARPRSTYAEAIRRLSAALDPAARATGPGAPSPYVVMVASSVPREGKTTLCLSLARMLAKTGKRVLLVDLDLHRPRVGAALGGRAPAANFDPYANTGIDDFIEVDERSGAHYIAAKPEEGLELFASERLRTILNSVVGRYDVVLLDTPPLMAVTDGVIVARDADACIFAVAWGRTPREVVTNSLRRLAETGVWIVGAVLTQVDIRRYANYGGGHYAHYGREYKVYYRG